VNNVKNWFVLSVLCKLPDDDFLGIETCNNENVIYENELFDWHDCILVLGCWLLFPVDGMLLRVIWRNKCLVTVPDNYRIVSAPVHQYFSSTWKVLD